MSKLRILHLEDNANDAFLVRRALASSEIDADITHVARSRRTFSPPSTRSARMPFF